MHLDSRVSLGIFIRGEQIQDLEKATLQRPRETEHLGARKYVGQIDFLRGLQPARSLPSVKVRHRQL